MESLLFLIAATIFAGGVWLAAFFWAARSRQFSDPKGAAHRILRDDYDENPKE